MLDINCINSEVIRFKDDLAKLSSIELVRKYVSSGQSVVLNDEKYFELRNELGEHFNVHPSSVLMVGSAKLGFSIAPTKTYRHFNEESDIDIALVSPKLFDEIWIALFDFVEQGGWWDRKDTFCDYLFRGWIRPDKLPPSGRFIAGDHWWETFRLLTASGRFGHYKIRGALYRDWHFFESYHVHAISICKSR